MSSKQSTQRSPNHPTFREPENVKELPFKKKKEVSTSYDNSKANVSNVINQKLR
jgi:hypothetical protein